MMDFQPDYNESQEVRETEEKVAKKVTSGPQKREKRAEQKSRWRKKHRAAWNAYMRAYYHKKKALDVQRRLHPEEA